MMAGAAPEPLQGALAWQRRDQIRRPAFWACRTRRRGWHGRRRFGVPQRFGDTVRGRLAVVGELTLAVDSASHSGGEIVTRPPHAFDARRYVVGFVQGRLSTACNVYEATPRRVDQDAAGSLTRGEPIGAGLGLPGKVDRNA